MEGGGGESAKTETPTLEGPFGTLGGDGSTDGRQPRSSPPIELFFGGASVAWGAVYRDVSG